MRQQELVMALSISRALPHAFNSLQDPISTTCSKRWSTSTSPRSSLIPSINGKELDISKMLESYNRSFSSCSRLQTHWLTRSEGRMIDNRSEKDHHNQTFRTEKQIGIFLALGGSCVVGLVLDNRLTEKKPEAELEKSDIRKQEDIGRLEKALVTFWL